MTDDPYVYPGTSILRNKLGITNAGELDRVERLWVTQRARAGVPTGDFDLPHLQAIHRHLFGRLYDWAGAIRTVELGKGGHQFMFRQYIHNGMADVHRRIVAADRPKSLTAEAFAEEAGRIIGDVNYVHPFREGNGRTQLLYLQQLSAVAGQPLDLTQIDPVAWIEASKRAHQADYSLMSQAIRVTLDRGAASRECETKSPAGEVPQMSAAEQARLSAAGSPEGARDAGRRKGRKPSGAGC
jgi:cell filamentation protein